MPNRGIKVITSSSNCTLLLGNMENGIYVWTAKQSISNDDNKQLQKLPSS